MQAILNVVLPVFGLIFAGMIAGRLKLLGENASEALNRYAYYFAMPPLLFLAMARVPVSQAANVPFLVAYIGGAGAVFLLVAAVAYLAFPGKPAQLALGGMAASFANTGYMGIPLFMTAFGPDGMLPVIIASVINSALMVGGAIAMIELDLQGGAGAIRAVRRVAIALMVNPLVVAPILGIACSAAGLRIPAPVQTFGDLIGASAGPCALFAIGLFLATRSVKTLVGGRKVIEVGWLIFAKLILEPLATWALGLYLGLDPFWLASAVILAALPTGALAFVIASNYGIFVERMSAVILGSTVFSVLSLSVVMVIFGGVRP